MEAPTGRDVFFSYAGLDADAVLKLAVELADRGLSLWVATDDDAVRSRLPDNAGVLVGDDFTAAIPRAIRETKVVLFFASPHAYASPNVFKELTLARENGRRTVPVFVAEPDRQSIPDQFVWYIAGINSINLYKIQPANWADRILRELRSLDITPTPKEAAPPARDGARVQPERGRLVPYLVDRWRQDRALLDSLEEHAQKCRRQPLALIAHGSEEQYVDAYVHRLEKDSLLEALTEAGYRNVPPQTLPLNWGGLGWEKLSVAELQRDIATELRKKFRNVNVASRLGDWPSCVPQYVSQMQQGLLLLSRLSCDRWSGAHFKALETWISALRDVPNLPPDLPCIALIVIETTATPEQKPGLLSFLQRNRPPDDLGAKLEALAKSCETLSAEPEQEGQLMVRTLPTLENATWDDVYVWARKVTGEDDDAAMRLVAYTKDIVGGGVGPTGIPMRRMFKYVQAAWNQFAAEVPQ